MTAGFAQFENQARLNLDLGPCRALRGSLPLFAKEGCTPLRSFFAREAARERPRDMRPEVVRRKRSTLATRSGDRSHAIGISDVGWARGRVLCKQTKSRPGVGIVSP
jgi:hypothetical protein